MSEGTPGEGPPTVGGSSRSHKSVTDGGTGTYRPSGPPGADSVNGDIDGLTVPVRGVPWSVPLSRRDGTTLREGVTVPETVVREWWAPADQFNSAGPEREEVEIGRRAVDWGHATDWFVGRHERYDDLSIRYTDGRRTSTVPLSDSWGPARHRETQADALAVGEAVGEYWPDATTFLLTLTAPGVVGGEPRPPADHLNDLTEAWSDFAYHALRNRMRELGVPSHQWLYWLQSEPHLSGPNAGYAHLHVWVAVDGDVNPADLRPVVESFTDHCPHADPAGHRDAISTAAGPGYLAKVPAFGEELADQPAAYRAWGAVHRATGKPRRVRSDNCKGAIAAARCDHHGENLKYEGGRGPSLVCWACGSGFGIDQSQTLTGARRARSGDLQSPNQSGPEGWPDASSVVRATDDGITVTGKGRSDGGRKWKADAIVRADGEEWPATGGGGRWAKLDLPLADRSGLLRCFCGFATGDKWIMARHTHSEHWEPPDGMLPTGEPVVTARPQKRSVG